MNNSKMNGLILNFVTLASINFHIITIDLTNLFFTNRETGRTGKTVTRAIMMTKDLAIAQEGTPWVCAQRQHISCGGRFLVVHQAIRENRPCLELRKLGISRETVQLTQES